MHLHLIISSSQTLQIAVSSHAQNILSQIFQTKKINFPVFSDHQTYCQD